MKLISSQSMLAEIWRLEIEIWKMYSFSILLYPEPLCGVAIFQADTKNKFHPIITQSYKQPDYSTVFQAKVEAINHGATLALEISDKTNDNLKR